MLLQNIEVMNFVTEPESHRRCFPIFLVQAPQKEAESKQDLCYSYRQTNPKEKKTKARDKELTNLVCT